VHDISSTLAGAAPALPHELDGKVTDVAGADVFAAGVRAAQ